MSIRAQLLLILLGSLFLCFSVAVLASYHVNHFDAQLALVLDRSLPIANHAQSTHQDLEALRDLEERMIRSDDPSYRVQLDDTAQKILDHSAKASVLVQSEAQLMRWTDLSNLLTNLRRTQRTMADLLSVEVREIAGRQRRMEPRLQAVRTALEVLRSDLQTEGLSPDVYAQANTHTTQAITLVTELEVLRYSSNHYEAFTPAFQRLTIPRYIQSILTHLDALDRLLQETPLHTQHTVLRTAFRELRPELFETHRRIIDINRRLVDLRDQSRLAHVRASRLSTEIEHDVWTRVRAQRRVMVQEQSFVAVLIFASLVMALLLVGTMAILVLRSLSSNLGNLTRASRALSKGDFSVTVENPSRRDELGVLAESFNAMASYLRTQRMRQMDYNQVVSALNSSLELEGVLRSSLRLIVDCTRSSLGAIYLREGERLVLVEGYALGGDVQETVEVGHGVVGQVARSRSFVQVGPLEQTSFKIEAAVVSAPTHLLVLPMVHLDEVLGVMVLGAAQRYDDESAQFVQDIAFQMAVSINNARFYQATKSTAQDLSRSRNALVDQTRALEKANQRLERAHRLKAEFLANVTHELRTPLNSILGFTELVLDTTDLPARPERNLNTVLRNAQNLLGLINDLLDISKMESGKLSISIEPFDMRPLLNEVVQVIRPMAQAKRLDVSLHIESSFPTAVYSDRLRCKQIITNLLSNAVKFTESGGVFLEASLEGPFIALRVRDSGIGIRAEDLEVIFEKFHQLDGSSSRKHGGTGLGLAIVRQLVGLLGGTISAASIPQEGSTFTVLLPTSPVATPHDEDGAPDPLPDLSTDSHHDLTSIDGEDPGGRPFVLLMDDDPTSVTELREGLASANLEVKSAFTAQDALDILTVLEPVCIVIGSTLPEEDGSLIMDRVWQHIKTSETPVLIVWDGRGPLPLPPASTSLPTDSATLDSLDLTQSKITRVMGCIQRPLHSEQVLDILRNRRILQTAHAQHSSTYPIPISLPSQGSS